MRPEIIAYIRQEIRSQEYEVMQRIGAFAKGIGEKATIMRYISLLAELQNALNILEPKQEKRK